jgi:hypothetical protein
VSGIEEITYALDFCANKRSRRESTATPHPSPADGNDSSIPRIARLMALAIRFDGLLRGETFRDYAELARLGHVTRARMTQIMKLLDLAPDIQEHILFLPNPPQIPLFLARLCRRGFLGRRWPRLLFSAKVDPRSCSSLFLIPGDIHGQYGVEFLDRAG